MSALFKMTRIVAAGAAFVAAALAGLPAAAGDLPVMTGGPIHLHEDGATAEIDALHQRSIETARALGLSVRTDADGIAAASERSLAFPLRGTPNATGVSPFSIYYFMDHDPSAGLRDYACGQRTYDGHGGVDISPLPFQWAQMDRSEIEIVAAAPGTIVQKVDGHYDRQCNRPSGQQANLVAVQHDDGLTAYYLHMKRGSVTAANVGDRVAAGDYLGLIGSSGRSGSPHLHFELRTASGQVVDPFAGACNATTSAWKHQWPAMKDTRIAMVATSSAPPVRDSTCSPNIGDRPNYANRFQAGATFYPIVALRDQGPEDRVRMEIFAPNGVLYREIQTGGGASPVWPGTWWYTGFALPPSGADGVWTVRATLRQEVVEHAFFVGPARPSTMLFGAVLPGGRSVRNNSPATLFATILNAGSAAAHGCSIGLETPIDAGFSFQTTDPNTNQLTGEPNKSVSIPAGGAQSFMIAFRPGASARADAWPTRLRFRCANAPNAQTFEGVNTALMSMSPNAVPDIIPISATPSNDQVVRIPGRSGTEAMAVASVNIGLGQTLTVRPRISGGAAAVATVCRNGPGGGCVAPPSAQVAHLFSTNAVATFSVFVRATGAIPFSPATHKVVLDFVDAGGVVRGQTGAAIMTR